MPKVACIMMQKDERFLLKPWLAYYGYLFGMNNLFVFDNGSTLAEVREMLVEYQAKGVNVNYDYATREHYEAKGEIIGNQIELLDRLGQYDFIIPLDCDEFILLKIDNGFFPSRHHILSYLDSFIGETAFFDSPTSWQIILFFLTFTIISVSIKSSLRPIHSCQLTMGITAGNPVKP